MTFVDICQRKTAYDFFPLSFWQSCSLLRLEQFVFPTLSAAYLLAEANFMMCLVAVLSEILPSVKAVEPQ